MAILRDSRIWRRIRGAALVVLLVVACGVIAARLVAGRGFSGRLSSVSDEEVLKTLALHSGVAQGGAEGDEKTDVPPEQVDKYIKVYKAVQRDKNLTVEQAASQQGFTLEAFRDIEAKIERDDLVRDRVRQELQKTAEKASPKGHGSPSGEGSSGQEQ